MNDLFPNPFRHAAFMAAEECGESRLPTSKSPSKKLLTIPSSSAQYNNNVIVRTCHAVQQETRPAHHVKSKGGIMRVLFAPLRALLFCLDFFFGKAARRKSNFLALLKYKIQDVTPSMW